MKITVLGPAPVRHKLKPIGKRLSQLLGNVDPSSSSLVMMVAYAHEKFCRYIGDQLEKFVDAGGDVEAIIGIDSRGTSKIALRWLLDLLGFKKVYVYYNPGDGTFHPKILILKEAEANHVFVGSSNLTAGGLFHNFEINVEIELSPADSCERSYLSTFEEIFRKTKNRPSCLQLSRKLLNKVDKAGALKHGSSKKAETAITKTTRTALSSIFEKTKHKRPRPTVKHLKKTKFVMSVVRNDVSGIRADPYFLVPITARDQDPKFWGWPTRFHPTRAKGVPERRFKTKVKIGKNRVTEEGRLSYYKGVDEFRFKSKAIYRLGAQYVDSFIVIFWERDKWGLSVAHVKLVKKGTRKYKQLSKLSFQQVGPLDKRFTYI